MLRKIGQILMGLNGFLLIRRVWFGFTNWRRGRFKDLDYVWLALPSHLDALPAPRPWFVRRVMGDPPMSLVELEQAFRRIADDPRPRGVILYVSGLHLPLADVQTLRGSLSRLRQAGKKVVCYAKNYDMAAYYLSSAADQVLIQPGGELMTLGLRLETVYLKDALDMIGVQLDKVAISPYKSAFDQLTRRDPAPENEAQINWVLDSRYDMIVHDIAAGRSRPAEAVRAMIDTAPHLDTTALEAGWIDGVMNQEGIAAHLGIQHIVPWERADKLLLKKWRKRARRYVALLPVRGTIIDGKSGSPPVDLPIPLVGSERAGDVTVIQHVRQLMDDDSAAAVILYVDSPGGSAAASEAITAALDQLAKDRPLVVYMNNLAASGGYYVATSGRWIVAQPGTLTGSIGVLAAKPVTQGLFEKLHTRRFEYVRGANAGLMTDFAPYTQAQRDQMWQYVTHLYDLFTRRVAASRKMTQDVVNAVGGGRIWTGKQALEHGLVDELGDLQTALHKAREMANLPEDAPLILPKFKDDAFLPPRLAQPANPMAGLHYLQEGVRLLFNNQALFLVPFVFRE